VSPRAGGRASRGVGRGLAAVLVAVALAAVAPHAAGAQQSRGAQGGRQRAIDILNAAAARFDSVRTSCADFTQRLDVTLLKETRTGKGRLCQRAPDLFAMRFTEPKGDAVVVDGSSVWVYYKSLDSTQVLKYAMSSAPGGYDFQRQFLTDPDTKYDLTLQGRESVDGRACDRIGLVPKDEASFKSAVVWVDVADKLLRQVRVVDENGSVRTITLSATQLDPRIPASWFTFEMPRGAHVVSPPGIGGG
jgi:outer membrane lipoprotein-sorting protein